MNVVFKQVHHSQFGEGTIVSQSATTVTVQFCEEYGTKMFVFPSAFELFLELSDPEEKAQMDKELNKLREKAQEERRLRGQEEQKRREEQLKNMLEQKRASTRKRITTKKSVTKTKKKPLLVETDDKDAQTE
ncbi:MAG: hypothetical protein VB078_05375 [Clostridiaceae bacterium]|nr:hypothetical protein [Clostridiaceae bacterium]